MSRRAGTSALLAVVGLAVAVVPALELTGSALYCGWGWGVSMTVAVDVAFPGSHTYSTPEQAAKENEWLDQFDVPLDARQIVTRPGFVRNGIVPVSLSADERVPPVFVVHVDGRQEMDLHVGTMPDGTYVIDGLTRCG